MLFMVHLLAMQSIKIYTKLLNPRDGTLNGIKRPNEINEQLVMEYFRRISFNDLDGLLRLFSDDAVIYQPFSKSTTAGKTQIESFLKTVLMVTSGTRTEVRIERTPGDNSQLIVFVTFIKSAILKGKFTFKVDNTKNSKLVGRIKSLKIGFVD